MDIVFLEIKILIILFIALGIIKLVVKFIGIFIEMFRNGKK